MASSSEKIVHLRQLLGKRLRPLHGIQAKDYPTNLPALDEIGIPRGGLTEIVFESSGLKGSLLLYGLLHVQLQKGERVVLIDGKDSFSPQGLSPAELTRLLWVRCRSLAEAIKAADLVVRDGNIPLVVLFLLLNPAGEFQRVSASAWHRLHLLTEKSAVTLLVFTPQAQVGCARLRLAVTGTFPLGKFHLLQGKLLAALHPRIERRRMERQTNEDLRRASCA